MSKGTGSLSMKVDDDRVRKALNRAVRGVSTHVRREWNAAGELLVEVMRSKLTAAGRGSGRLGRAVKHRITDRRGLMELEVGPRVGDPEVEPYDEVIEHGRGKNKGFPPPGVLDDFIRQHGIPEEAAYPIAAKIDREGIQASPYMRPAFEQVGPLAASAITRIGEAVVADFESG